MSTMKAIKNACERLEFEVRSYSGRGMYGRKCVGFVVSQGTSPASFAFKLAVELGAEGDDGLEVIEELIDRAWCQDSMGLDTIVYVPGVAWCDEEEEEEDQD